MEKFVVVEKLNWCFEDFCSVFIFENLEEVKNKVKERVEIFKENLSSLEGFEVEENINIKELENKMENNYNFYYKVNMKNEEENDFLEINVYKFVKNENNIFSYEF